jgi:hypothetical protein
LEKERFINENNRSLCKKSHSQAVFTTGFPSHPAPACLFWACTDGASSGSRHGGAIPGGNNGEGIGVLVNLTSGVWNTGTGFGALNHDAGGKNNTAAGVRALFSNGNGSYNTATGVYALYGNTIGWYNNAVGAYALAHNTTASSNTANGYSAL